MDPKSFGRPLFEILEVKSQILGKDLILEGLLLKNNNKCV